MSEIVAGDIVTLKSGSADMTVQWVNRDGTTGLVWSDHNGDHKTASYNVSALKKSS